MKALRLTMEPWRVHIPVVAEELDSDPHLSKTLKPDPYRLQNHTDPYHCLNTKFLMALFRSQTMPPSERAEGSN
jgi:hypothetical protein